MALRLSRVVAELQTRSRATPLVDVAVLKARLRNTPEYPAGLSRDRGPSVSVKHGTYFVLEVCRG